MVVSILVKLLMEKAKVMVLGHGQMVTDMKETGEMVRKTVKVFIHGLVVLDMKETGKMV